MRCSLLPDHPIPSILPRQSEPVRNIVPFRPAKQKPALQWVHTLPRNNPARLIETMTEARSPRRINASSRRWIISARLPAPCYSDSLVRNRGILGMLIEQQITERRERAAGAIAKILKRPTGAPYGDYSVKSASGKTYRLAMRGPGLFENYCSCPDFRVNTLGTCKHIEALLLRLRRRHGAALDRKGYARTRASISLQIRR